MHLARIHWAEVHLAHVSWVEVHLAYMYTEQKCTWHIYTGHKCTSVHISIHMSILGRSAPGTYAQLEHTNLVHLSWHMRTWPAAHGPWAQSVCPQMCSCGSCAARNCYVPVCAVVYCFHLLHAAIFCSRLFCAAIWRFPAKIQKRNGNNPGNSEPIKQFCGAVRPGYLAIYKVLWGILASSLV